MQSGTGLSAISLANIRRHKARSAFIATGVAVAVATAIAIISLVVGVRESVDDRLARYGASLAVTPSNPELSLDYGGISVSGAGSGEIPILDQSVVGVIRDLPSSEALAEVVPVLLQPVEIGGGRYLALGTDIPAASRAKPWWRVDGIWPNSADQLVVGALLAEKLKAAPGSELVVGRRSYRVSGVLAPTGGEEDNIVIMDGGELASTTGRAGELNLVEVSASDVAAVERISAEIQAALPDVSVVSVKKTLELTLRTNEALTRFGLAAILLVTLVAGLVVGLSMMASVKERQREIGVLRAVGFRRRHVMRLLLSEVGALSLAGAGTGAVVGLTALWLAPQIAGGSLLSFAPNPVLIAACVAASLALALISAVYPALAATRLDPAIALKTI